jgi:two-component system chemotaxis sensor kinase CheA
MDDIVNDFLVESFEGLDQLDRDLVALESAPTDGELLARVFRCVHTVKGTCGFLGFGKLESVAHVGESLLARLRDGELVLDSARTSALLSLVDAIRAILGKIESSGQEGDADYSALIKRLEGLLEPGDGAPPAVAAMTNATHNTPAQAEHPGQPDAQGNHPVGHPRATVAELGDAPVEARGNVGSATDSSIRVDVGLLDRLMNLVGELVLARNQILQHATTEQGVSLTAASQRLNLLTTELQEGVMKTRMQPIGNIWGKLPRVVRDLAVACNKQIRLDMEGKETELDKTIIEAIKDPLTHIVRNSADHGIETPDVRVPRGKPAEGRLSLRAYHEGGQVIIEIADDGAGIDAERIKQKAVEKGLISADQAARMGEREALNLVFLPGLSTARQVTNISGRGVGMDVVKSNIEKIGGAVDIQSKLGEGTTLKIKIPLTLAIIPALVVSCHGNRYAIPQVNLVELVRREQRESGHGIEMIHGAPVYRLRGNLLPLVYLRSALESGASAAHDDALNIVVLQADDRTFGLVVDEINDTEEIVVKPLGKQLKGLIAFAGATIMGDGRVALILDVMGLAQRAHVISEVRERRGGEQATHTRAALGNRQTLLVCGLGETRRVAIPLSSVARLEEFPATSVEHAGQYDVVQYRDQILPLLDLPAILGVSSDEARTGMLSVVVYSANGRNVGFVVGRILDIVEDAVQVDVTTTREGMQGSIVVQQRVTDVLDMNAIVRNAAPWLLESAVAMENAA